MTQDPVKIRSKPSIYLTPGNRRFLEKTTTKNLSGRINQVVARYATLVEATPLPKFSEDEVALMTLAVEDHPDLLETGEVSRMVRTLENILSHPLTNKTDPRLHPLLTTLKQLTPLQVLALAERLAPRP